MVNLRDVSGLRFESGVVENKGVLFLHQEDNERGQFQYLLGNKVVPYESRLNFFKNINGNHKFTKSRGILYKHVIFPSKPYTYRKTFKALGVGIKKISTNDVYEHKDVFFPDLNFEEYDADDTHINDIGLFKIIYSLVDELFGFKLPDPVYESIIGVGDLGKMIDAKAIEKKRFLTFKKVVKREADYVFSLKKNLKGNSGHIDIHLNSSALMTKRVVIFGDSFFRSSLHILNQIFSEVVYFRCPYIIPDIVNSLVPDAVLTGNAERYLINVPDASKPRPYFLNFLTANFNSQKISRADTEFLELFFSGRGRK